MKKKNKNALSFVALIVIAIGVYFLANPNRVEEQSGLAKACDDHLGKWLEEYQECEYPDSRAWCEEAGGTFLECESACRHDPEAEICTMQCVIVCKF